MKGLMIPVLIATLACPLPAWSGDEVRGGDDAAAAGKTKSSKSNISERGSGSSEAATSVKSGKSNQGGAGAAESSATTVKSGKSNSSD